MKEQISSHEILVILQHPLTLAAYTMRRFIILLCLVLCLIAFWLMRTAFQATKPDATKSAPTTKSPPAASNTAKPSADDLAELYSDLMSAPQSNKEPVPFKTRGRVHLKPGESAVIGFWQVSKDSNGLAVVTPKVMPDGTINFDAQLLKVSDAVTQAEVVRDLFPSPFDVEQYGALGPDAIQAALKHLGSTEGVDRLAMPSIVTRSNAPAQIRIGEVDGSDQLKRGLSLMLTGGTPAPDGSLDLNLSLELK